MATCEKCWNKAGLRAAGDYKLKEKIYVELMDSDNCSPEEQAGMEADICQLCDRKSIHIKDNCCMNDDCEMLGIIL